MKLIPDWRRAWRWWSVRVSALGLLTALLPLISPDVLLALWNSMPGELRMLIPAHVEVLISAGLFGATILARLLKQKGSDDGR